MKRFGIKCFSIKLLFVFAFGWSSNVCVATDFGRKDERSDSLKKVQFFEKLAKEDLDAWLKESDSYHRFSNFGSLINDKETLIAVLEPILFNIYGKENIISERPYLNFLFDNYWCVTGTLPDGCVGGTFMVAIDRRDCRIIGISHGK